MVMIKRGNWQDVCLFGPGFCFDALIAYEITLRVSAGASSHHDKLG